MIYFISGHTDLSYEDFERYYIPKINQVLEEDIYAEFVVGDCEGVDKYAMDYIYTKTCRHITIYHTGDTPENLPTDLEAPIEVDYMLDPQLSFRKYFISVEECNATMTRDSHFDIAFVKDNRWNSMTAENIKRRSTVL